MFKPEKHCTLLIFHGMSHFVKLLARLELHYKCLNSVMINSTVWKISKRMYNVYVINLAPHQLKQLSEFN